MIGDLLKHQVFAQLAPHTDTTARTGAPNWLTAATKPYLPVVPDGFGLVGSIAKEDHPTEHRDRGIRYDFLSKRNEGAQPLNVGMHPELAGTILDFALGKSATGLPRYHGARQWFEGGVIAGGGLGREARGVLAKTFALQFDRTNPAAIVANITAFVNRDSELHTYSTRFSVTAATNASPIVLTIGSHSIQVGEPVIVDGVRGNTAANGFWTVSAVTATTITLSGSAGNAAYTSGGTVQRLVYEVSGATNATPVVLTIGAHEFVAGDTVVVTGVGGNTGANGTWTITAVTSTTITLGNSVGNGVYTSGGYVARQVPPGSGYTVSWPTQEIYKSSGAYIDLQFGDSNGNFGEWAGDNTDIKTISLNGDNGAEVDVFAANAVDDLNQTWTKAYSGDDTVSLQLGLVFANSAYTNYHRMRGIRKFRARIMVVGTNPSGSTTTVNSEAKGTSVVVEVGSTSGFAIGDYCLLNDSASNKQCVAKITAISAGVSLTFDELDVALAAGATVQNTAWELKVATASMTTAPVLNNQGQVKGVTVSGEGRLSPTVTTVLSYKAYDDDGV